MTISHYLYTRYAYKIHIKQIINNIVVFIIFLYSSFHSDVFVIRANTLTIYEWNQSVKRGEKKNRCWFFPFENPSYYLCLSLLAYFLPTKDENRLIHFCLITWNCFAKIKRLIWVKWWKEQFLFHLESYMTHWLKPA